MLTSQEALGRIISDLKTAKSDDVRMRAANELRQHVKLVSRELNGEAFTKFMNDINRRIFELIHSQDNTEKLGGILLIDRLVDLEGEENTTKITRFANYLRNVLPGNEIAVMAAASKALGRLAVSGGTLTADFVEFEVKRSLDWLHGDRNENKRQAAVYVLKELAQNAPTIVYAFVPAFLDVIWVALRDPKSSVREIAAEALGACLDIVRMRESSLRGQWYKRLVEEIQKGFKQSNVELLHGSLLALGEMLTKAGKFMDPFYVEMCDSALKCKDHRDVIIRKLVMQLLPVLADCNTNEFVSNYLHASMTHLLASMKKERYAFISTGKIALAVGSSISPYLDTIISNLREGLAGKAKSKVPAETNPLFKCISMLAIAVGQALTKHMHDLLDQMFSVGLSDALRQALVDIGKNINPLLPLIQERLLNTLSLILSGQPFRQPGAPDRAVNTQMSNALREIQVSESKDTEQFVLALHTLGTFDFSGHSLSEFVRECVVGYLEDDNPEIRKAAALSCGQVLVNDPIHFQTNSYAMQIVSEVLEKLLTVGIADPDPEIRQAVLSSLDERFDNHLAQPENIRSLFMALNDEVFSIRELAITIIGRLTTHNPAYVLPSLRKTLIQLLTELEYSIVSRTKEESARLLGHLVSASQRLIKPYVEPILKVLLPKLKDPSPGVAAQVLAAVGELAQVGREDLTPYIPELMPQLIDTIQDQSSSAKREAALRTLGHLATNTSFVIEPYRKYPKLLFILMTTLKTEQLPSIRREAIKVMGILGALDPYRHKMTLLGINDGVDDTEKITEYEIALLAGPAQNDDYYPTITIHALMKILNDASLSVHHTAVVQAVMYTLKSLGLKCVPFLPQIMTPYLNMMKTCPKGILEFHFQQLSVLVSIVKQHIRNYLVDILSLIQEHWNPQSNFQLTIISLVESIAEALETEFKIYLPNLLPHILMILETDTGEKRQVSLKVLHALTAFGSNIQEYLHLVVPAIVKIIEQPDAPIHVRRAAIQTLGQLTRRVNFADHASRIVHPLARILQQPYQELKLSAMEAMCAVVYQLQSDFIVFVPMMNKVLTKNKVSHPQYDILISKLLMNEPLPQEMGKEVPEQNVDGNAEDAPSADASGTKKLPVNQQHLKKAWETSQRSTKDDWVEWMRRLSVELLKESPSHALRACASLAAAYYPLARELFNAAFVSCWTELYDQFQDELVRSLETALTSPTIPPEVLQTLLNLAEFMEHDDKTLPIDQKTLGAYAAKCHAYAKALHYKELEFMSEPLPDTIEALISINNQLQQPDAAIGILTYAQQKHSVELKESWYEKLQRWEDALVAYNKRQTEDPSNIQVTLGRMRCLHALGEWEQLSQLAQEKWFGTDDDTRKMIAPLAAAAAWGLGQFELMDDYIAAMKSESADGVFLRAILAIHRNQFDMAEHHIDKTRELLDTELKALVGESYSRAYNAVVRVQMLAELEEIISYKKYHDMPDRQAVIRKTWMNRLMGCEQSVDVWQRILKVRSLVVAPQEDKEMWIKFANLCRKSGRLGLSLKILTDLVGSDNLNVDTMRSAPPETVYAYLKHVFATGNKTEALTSLKVFTQTLASTLENAKQSISFSDDKELQDSVAKNSRVLARCYLKLGEWQNSIEERWVEDTLPEILHNYSDATKYDKNWYKAWHAWALANFEVISMFEKEKSEDTLPNSKIINYVVPATQGFFKSIALSKGNSLQDTLRLLTLWFKYGYHQDVYQTISDGFATVSIDTWLQVIPQLIARIHAPSPQVRRLNHQLLSDIGKEHPQALVYSLTVASKSQSTARKSSALAIMDKMRLHSSKLVEQALLVSQELIRVAILWHEMWHEGLEEASRLYFGEHNVKAMFDVLEPLHRMLERGPETLRETSFNHAFGRDLQEALEWGRKYKQTRVENDLHQAWDLYYHVFRRINKQLPQLTTLELQYVSPKLQAAQDLELAVPGSYRSGEPVVRIANFVPTLTVITSKQRPRKLTIKGSDGREYQYLLKGHEDLRQDERVMQLFGLVNTLLSANAETFKRHLNITRYPVIPLSPNSGLIGWVPHCDTLHSLIRDYRESKKIMLNIEHRLMLQMAPDYDNLTLMQKIEVFQHALDQTTGQDLAKVLWQKSRTSEVWLDRRTNYERSLAVMSIVGYILGLGDRHPSNLMLDRFTGRIIHIDFGDCFEVAMLREKFPEKIPFRLTRMLVNAMEVSGIEGSFRTTCESVMDVLRENKESLMAVLEAFVYDPLINWRLFGNLSSVGIGAQGKPSKAANAGAGTSMIEEEFLEEAGVNTMTISRKLRKNENEIIDIDGADDKPEMLNSKAVAVINRVQNKLTGRDFRQNATLAVPAQVDKLIQQATAVENLCQCYIGWCPFW